MSDAIKFLPCDWSLTDEEARAQGRITPDQEWAILRILEERGRSRGVILADEQGGGKTLMGTEAALRGGFERVLFIGLPNTHDQWVERIALQSDGQVQARVMNGSKAGKENLARFLAGEPGFYVAGSHYLTTQDFQSEPLYWDEARAVETLKRSANTRPLFKIVHKTGDMELRDRKRGRFAGELTLVDREEGAIGPAYEPWIETVTDVGVIGPAQEPVRKTKSVHQEFYRRKLKKHPLDLIVFDEMQLIANKHAPTRRTILSMSGEQTFRLGMSGTWFHNDVDNMFSGSRWVWPGVDPETGRSYVESNHRNWRELWLTTEVVVDEDGWPIKRNGRQVERVTGEKELGAFVASLPCYIRRESLIPIPEAEVILIDPLPRQKEQMEDLQRDLLTWVMTWDGEEEPLVVDMPPELHTRLRQAALAELSFDDQGNVAMADDAESAVLAPLHGLLTRAWPGQQVAVYTDSKVFAKFVERRMRAAGANARAWHGDLTKKQRAELKEAFIAGEVQYLIATIQSFGTGIDGLQKACDKVIWLSEADGNPALNAQAIRRFLRPGMILRAIGADGQPVSDFRHVKVIVKDTPHETGMQTLIHRAWMIRASLAAPTAA